MVDFDPDGIGILRTYQHGSRSLGHEENAELPGLAWLGVKSSDILGLPQRPGAANDYGAGAVAPESGQEPTQPASASLRNFSHLGCVTSPLKQRDRKKAVNLLHQLSAERNPCWGDMELIRELQSMLVLNAKAEMQAVDVAGDLTRWLDARLAADLASRP